MEVGLIGDIVACVRPEEIVGVCGKDGAVALQVLPALIVEWRGCCDLNQVSNVTCVGRPPLYVALVSKVLLRERAVRARW